MSSLTGSLNSPSLCNFNGRRPGHRHVVVLGGISHLPWSHLLSSPNLVAANLHSFNNSSINLITLQPKHRNINMRVNAIENIPGGTPLPSNLPPGPNPFSGWSSWLLWTLIPMLLPFFKNKWGPLLKIKKEVDTAIQAVECAVEVVEDVARKVDEVVEDVEKNLPEGSKLKESLRKIEHAAEEAIKGADLAEELIHKAEEAEKKLESLMEEVDHQEQKAVP